MLSDPVSYRKIWIEQTSSPKKYFQKRLEQGGRFALNVEYLFVAQFITKWHQITSSFAVAIRKSLTGTDGESFNTGFFKHNDHIRPLITKDDANHFFFVPQGESPLLAEGDI